MVMESMKKINEIKMVPIPQKIKVPSNIPASKLRIPSTYAEGDIEYEDDKEKNVNVNNATHLKFTAKDKRSDLIVGPVKEGGMFKLNIYMDNANNAIKKDESTHTRQVILNEDYRAIKFFK